MVKNPQRGTGEAKVSEEEKVGDGASPYFFPLKMKKAGGPFMVLFCVIILKVIHQTVQEDFKLCNSVEDSKMSTGPEFGREKFRTSS